MLQQIMLFFLFLPINIYATYSPKQDSPARYILTLGSIENCCQEIEELLASNPEEVLLRRTGRKSSFLDERIECSLYAAIMQKKRSIISLLQQKPEANIPCLHGQNALHIACGLFSEQNDRISEAAMHLKYLIIKGLLILGFDPNMTDANGNIPFNIIMHPLQIHIPKYLDTIEMLLRAGSNPNHPNECKNTFIHGVIISGLTKNTSEKFALIQLLLKYKANPNFTPNNCLFQSPIKQVERYLEHSKDPIDISIFEQLLIILTQPTIPCV